MNFRINYLITFRFIRYIITLVRNIRRLILNLVVLLLFLRLNRPDNPSYTRSHPALLTYSNIWKYKYSLYRPLYNLLNKELEVLRAYLDNALKKG